MDGYNYSNCTCHNLHGKTSILLVDSNWSSINFINKFHRTISKEKTVPSSTKVGKFGRIDLIPFNKGKSGLSIIFMEDLQDLNPLSNNIEVNSIDYMWLYKKWKHEEKVPDWNGFMQMLTKNRMSVTSPIVYLPIIDAPASDYDTIHTALRIAVQRLQTVNQDLASLLLICSCSSKREILSLRVVIFHQ
ncbi:PREDICTED: uncharacterized protein LOC105448724 [Wasmannia auropunctata]|uniref:uncharacterized protein LOC105448724 n=1 Tax=Wasmannia auropunctata TaxID=64793 RepID=UPI0005EF3FFB|nr:PREDICTED: uncharacterized protein LOC105448724 [Wasmannia auropunctata]